MIKINQMNLKTLNNRFNGFAQQTVSNNKPNVQYVSSQLQKLEKQYNKLDATELFCMKSLELAQNLEKTGLRDVSGIIYSGLVKIPTIPIQMKEAVILSGLKNAQKNGDSIHVLARIVDLKYIYKTGNKKKYIKILFEEEKQLNSIVEKYEQKSLKYRTVHRDVNNLEKYQFRLAASKVDLGKALLHSNSNVAMKKLQEAKVLFLNLNRQKEFGFANELISQIKL